MKFPNIAKTIPVALMSFVFASCGQTLTAPRQDKVIASSEALQLKGKLDILAPTLLEKYDVPSVGVAYIENGKLAWSDQYGLQSLDTPASDQTLYNIASMSKPIAAEIALQLASEGVISLDEKMSPFWIDPDIQDDPRHEALTPRMALQHQIGFTNWRFNNEDGKLKFSADPGTKTKYSGEGYDYLGRFLEKKTGESFPDLARKYVFDRLDMPQSSFVKENWYEGRLAHPHGPNEWREPDAWDKWSAADNVHTNPAEYAKFMISVMEDQNVSKEIADTRHDFSYNRLEEGCPFPIEHCPEAVGFGLGWSIFDYENADRVIMHDGSDWGENTMGFFIPETQNGVIVFTNDRRGGKVIADISELLYPELESFNAFLKWQASR